MPRRRKTQKTATPQETGPVIRLRHAIRSGDFMFYAYDGELPVRDSIIEIPASRPEWVQRAWIMGFRLTAEGRVVANLDAEVRAQLSADAVETPEGCCPNECCPDSATDPCVESCVDDCCPGGDNTDCACAVTPVDETETAESGEETTDEGAATGGQSPDDDG